MFALEWSGDGRSIQATIGTPAGEQRFSFPFGEAHNLANALAAIAIGEALEVPLDEMAQRAPGITFSRLRGELVELADGIVVVNDCYNANPISMRAALDHLASLAAPGRHVAVLGEMAELGPNAADYHREVGSHARQLGVGPDRRGWRACPRLRARRLGPGCRGGRAARRGDAPAGRRGAGQGLALGRPRAGHRRADRPTRDSRAMSPPLAALASEVASSAIDRGQILIAGMAAMLITIFLGPKFIEFLRAREFGQQIREEGPAEHQTKAGTPTMGGLIVFVAIAVPYLVLSPRDTQSLAVFGVALGAAAVGFADDFIKVTKRRSLGLSARWKLLAQIGLAVALWWVASRPGGARPAAPGADLRRRASTSGRCSTCSSSSW